jgi:Lrp/AsnC family transcriptional regulator for asnA, asnC and gidA
MNNDNASPAASQAFFNNAVAPAVKIKIDDIDRRIIVALKQNGRTPFAQIAQQLGVSTGMVRQRYQRLVNEGVVQVVAVSNPMMLGFNTMALLGIKADGRRLQEIAQEIAAFDEVIYLVLSAGGYDILAEVICRDNAHLLDFLSQRLHSVDGVRETETFMYLQIVKESYAWRVPNGS